MFLRLYMGTDALVTMKGLAVFGGLLLLSVLGISRANAVNPLSTKEQQAIADIKQVLQSNELVDPEYLLMLILATPAMQRAHYFRKIDIVRILLRI